MRHPFDGLIERSPDAESAPEASRRSFLAVLAALAGGASTFAVTEAAEAQPRYTTQALGEEGGRPGRVPPGHGGIPPGHSRRRVTTFAVGEEGGPWVRPPHRRVTTLALGEEGGRSRW